MSRAAYLARLERERLAAVERRGRARLEAQTIAEGVTETMRLSQARGAAFEAPAGRAGPMRRLVGLDWLVRKGRLTLRQKAAGEDYGLCYRRALGEAAIASTLDLRPDGGTGTPMTAVLARAETHARARERLAFYRERLRRQPALVAACDLICGQELTPREAVAGDRETYRLEAVLEVALDILAAERV